VRNLTLWRLCGPRGCGSSPITILGSFSARATKSAKRTDIDLFEIVFRRNALVPLLLIRHNRHVAPDRAHVSGHRQNAATG